MRDDRKTTFWSSFIVSALVAAFLAWRWYVRRQVVGFEQYLDDVTRVELELLQLAESGRCGEADLHRAQARLSRLKTDALEQFSSGRLHGDDSMNGFLIHVSDVRNFVAWLSSRPSHGTDLDPVEHVTSALDPD
jgi:uncharacterized membrane protein